LGGSYNGASVVSVGNPEFASFTLPNYNYQNVNNATGFDFHLSSGSPAIGKGFTSFGPMQQVPLSASFGATSYTLPGGDMGCYQSSGTGNQH
jgi:hypothetical protein